MVFGPMVGVHSAAQIPLFQTAIPAGFPSSVDKFVEGQQEKLSQYPYSYIFRNALNVLL